MRKLTITTQTKAVINPEFTEMFAHNFGKGRRGMMHIHEPFLTELTADNMWEARAVQAMAEFMLTTGYKMGVRLEDSRTVFADCDDDLIATYGDEWQLEQAYTQLKFTDEKPSLKDLLSIFRQEKAHVPFTDEQYYTMQIMDLMGYSYATAEDLAGKLRDFTVFQESGKDVEDTSVYLGMNGCPNPGRVYMSDGEPDMGLVIDSTDSWKDEQRADGRWHLVICNTEHQSDDLEELELILFDWAAAEGWMDGK